MKINERTAIITPSILLVPYSSHHVPEYHKWMQDEDLQKATASEPLSIDEEYAMQKSWRMDADKLTFIACLPPSKMATGKAIEIVGGQDDPDENMIGDVNLFLSESDEDGEDILSVGELEIMVARKDLQNRGIGKEILLTFLWFILGNLEAILLEYSQTLLGEPRKLKYLRVKINAENTRSIRLFERVGFMRISDTPNYFNELELRLSVMAAQKMLTKKFEEELKIASYRLPET